MVCRVKIKSCSAEQTVSVLENNLREKNKRQRREGGADQRGNPAMKKAKQTISREWQKE